MDINHGIEILGTGSYKPEIAVNNEEFANFIETDDEWIYSRTGIKRRGFNAGRTNFFMAANAAKQALASANTSADEIGLIITSTASPDFYYPSMSCLVQNIIGAKNAAALDVSAACTGFIYGLDVARNYLALGKYKKILVIASEFLSEQTDFTDRSTCVLFGDGAGAAVVTGSDKAYASVLGAVGDSYPDMQLYCKANYKNNNPFVKNISEKSVIPEYIQMNGKEVYKFAVDIMARAVTEVCADAGFALSDLDLLIPHQANIRIINTAMKSLDIPMEKVCVIIEDYGNISSACIPTCLNLLNNEGRLKRGLKICMVAFGAGMTYGATAFES